MSRMNAYQNGKKYGLKESAHENNARYPKPNPKKSWVAGGHAPQGKLSPELAKRVKEYLERTGQLR
jgi:hypothetical protein